MGYAMGWAEASGSVTYYQVQWESQEFALCGMGLLWLLRRSGGHMKYLPQDQTWPRDLGLAGLLSFFKTHFSSIKK